MVSSPVLLALLYLVAMPRGFAQESIVSTTCSSDEGSGCIPGKLGSGDDTQVFLQSQKRVEIHTGSPKKHSDQELLSALLEIVEKKKRTSQDGEDESLSFNVQVSASEFELSMTTTAVVKSGNEVLQHGQLVVEIGGKVQSVSGPSMNPIPGDYKDKAIYQAMIHGYGPNDPQGTDVGKPLKFRYFVEELGAGSVLDLEPPTPMTFINNGHTGNAVHPLELNLVVPPGAGTTPPPGPCADKTGDDYVNGFVAIFGEHYRPYAHAVTCQTFHGWSQCSLVQGLCDQTCGQCGSPGFFQLNAFKHASTRNASNNAGTERLAFEPRVHAPNFENSMTGEFCVRLVQDSGCDSTGVLVAEMGNNVIQGVAKSTLVPPTLGPFGGQHLHLLMVHGYGINDRDNAGKRRDGDDGKPIKFQYFIEGEGKIYDLKMQDGSDMTFVTNDHKGSAIDPVILTIDQ